MDRPPVKKASLLLIFLAVLSIIAAVVAVIFYFNIDKYIRNEAYIINPTRKEVVGFETAQTLYMYVDDIDDVKNSKGGVDTKVTLKTLGDNDEQKEVEVVATDEMGSMDYFSKTITYWDRSTDKTYNFEDKPDTIPDGIKISDIVLVYYRVYMDGNSTLTDALIKTVLK